MIDFMLLYYSKHSAIIHFLMKSGGGGELSLRFIVLLLHGLFCVFTVISDYTLDEPGFKAPGAPTSAPPSSDSYVETPPEVRRRCIACPRRMSKKTADRHTLCVSCRGFDCDIDTRCEECMEWPEEEVRIYAKCRKSFKSKDSSKSKPSAPPPPPADSVPSSQPPTRVDIQSQVDSLSVTVTSLAENFSARLGALTASLLTPPLTQLSSQSRLGPDVGEPQPGVTAGTRRMFQALGVPDRTSVVPAYAFPLDQGARAPAMEQSGSASAPQPQLAPGAAPPPPPLLFRLRLLRVMGIRLPNRQHLFGFLQALLQLAQLVTLVRHRSRRPVKRRAMSPSETPPRLVWLTSSMRSARILVRCRTLHVHPAAGLRLVSASLSLRPPDSASDFTPGLRR